MLTTIYTYFVPTLLVVLSLFGALVAYRNDRRDAAHPDAWHDEYR